MVYPRGVSDLADLDKVVGRYGSDIGASYSMRIVGLKLHFGIAQPT
jgi:hypothetical protein